MQEEYTQLASRVSQALRERKAAAVPSAKELAEKLLAQVRSEDPDIVYLCKPKTADRETGKTLDMKRLVREEPELASRVYQELYMKAMAGWDQARQTMRKLGIS